MARIFIGNVKGVGIEAIYKQYYVSTSSSEVVGGSWIDIAPTLSAGQYLWSRWKAELTDGSVEATDAVKEGIAGDDVTNLERQVVSLTELLQTIAPDSVVDIAHGGTGATTAEELRQNLNFIDVNPITSTADDTPANWAALGTGIAQYNTNGLITDQPSTYASLENIVIGDGQLVQVWHKMGTAPNPIYYRTGGANGWSTPWTKMLDETNGIQMKKLWQNASPASAFAEQDISLGENYDFVYVECRISTVNSYTFGFLISKNSSYVGYTIYTANQTNIFYATRILTLNGAGNKLTISGCSSKNIVSTAAGSTINTSCLPVAVYGIKGVQ